MTSGEEVESPVAVPNKGKHQWTATEDDKLVLSLHELFLLGAWKADTGFKSGYLYQLEKMLEAKMPGCGMKGVPHIESRIRTLKKQTMALAEMLNNGSGFGWNNESKTIECEQEVFDNWVKSHPAARGLKSRPFPHYVILNEIYGKDRANGKGATTPGAEEEEIEAAGQEGDENNSPGDDGVAGMDISDTQNRDSATESVRKRCKKNSDNLTRGMTEVSTAITKLVDSTVNYLSDVSRALKDEFTPSREVARSLQSMVILTRPERMAVAKTITSDEYMMSMFLELPQDERVEMVIDLLKL